MLTKKINRYRRALALLLLCIAVCFKFNAQLSIVDSIINTCGKYASIKINKTYYFTSTKKAEHFTGSLDLIKIKGNNIKYRIIYEGRYDAIKTNKLSGYNDLRLFDYTNYIKNKPEHKNEGEFLFDYIFSPDFFKSSFEKKHTRIIERINHIDSITLSVLDTNNVEVSGGIAQLLSFKSIYTISNKTYLIGKIQFMPLAQIGDVLMDDSTTLFLNYVNKTKKEINNHINNFKPFKEKVEVPELPDNLNDTIKYFPAFEIYDTLNTKISTNKFKSKFTLVEFWYKSCAPCLANMKELEKVRKRFSTDDLEIIALNLNDSIDDQTKKIITKSKYNYKFYFGDKKNKKNILIRGYPTSFLYNSSNQKIVLNHLGGGPNYSKQMINLIENKLKEYDKN